MTFYQLRILYLMAFCLCLTVKAAAQQPVIEDGFRMLTFRDGLAGTSVTDIITDHNGEMWIATSNGVNTYNGKRLTTFKLGEESLQSHVYHVYEAPDHHILATTANGIFSIGYGDNGFQRIVPQISTAETLLPWNGDTLFIGNRDGLHLFDGSKLTTIHITDAPMDMANSVRDIQHGPDGRVWFVSRHALNAYCPQTDEVTSMELEKLMPDGASLSRMANCGGDTWYVGTKNDGLYHVDSATGTVRRVADVGNVVTSLRFTDKGKLCVGTDGSGAYLIDPSTETIEERFSIDLQGRHHAQSNAVYCYYRDTNGVDWLGYYRYGLSHTYHVEPLFQPYRYGDFTTEGMSVRSYLIEDDYSLIGTNDGFFFIDQQRDLVRHVTPAELGGAHIITSIVRYRHLFYIATYDGGVRCFDPQTMTVSKLTQNQKLEHITVGKLIVNPIRGTLNMGTSEGLFVLRPNNELITFNEANSKLGGGSVNDISFDADGNAWLSSEPGLTLYTQQNDQFQSQGFPEGFFNNIRALKGSRGHDRLQFFYNADGVYYTDPQLKHFGQLRFLTPIKNEFIIAFVDDQQGRYWIGTERGLFSLDYQMNHLQHFGEAEGIVSQFISDASLSTDSTGRLWMGTSNGLYYTRFSDIEQWRQHASHNMLLYDIRIGGELMAETQQALVNERQTIQLSWNLRSQTLQALPVVTDYSLSSGRIYEYRIDNDAEWKLISNDKPLVVERLMIGRHKLTIRLSGLQGTEKTYTVIVKPSTLAYIELLLLIISLSLLIWWWRYRKSTRLLLRERDTMEEALIEMVEREQANEQGLQSEERQKYERVKVNELECEGIVKRMRKYLDEQKAYQNPDLKMSDLAEVLSLSPSKLSQVFNLYLNENYYEFINNYRLAEFKRRIEAGDAERFTLIALSEQCGFKKSSFFATFRRIEGMTPTEYLKKKHKI